MAEKKLLNKLSSLNEHDSLSGAFSFIKHTVSETELSYIHLITESDILSKILCFKKSWRLKYKVGLQVTESLITCADVLAPNRTKKSKDQAATYFKVVPWNMLRRPCSNSAPYFTVKDILEFAITITTLTMLTLKELMFIGPCIIAIVEEWKTNLMSLVILFHLLCTQHVSDINISMFRSLRLCWWITTSVVLFCYKLLSRATPSVSQHTHKKWNKIASDIKLVFHSSTIAMMHGPINIRLNYDIALLLLY